MPRAKSLGALDPIYGALQAADGPMTAYQVLDAVRDKGISAPPTVYRALNRLVADGLAHRVESINAYVACSHSHHGDESAIFAICDNCGAVEEIDNGKVLSGLKRAAEKDHFQVQHMAVELRGLCDQCQDRAEEGDRPEATSRP